jgi:hypothetical protein
VDCAQALTRAAASAAVAAFACLNGGARDLAAQRVIHLPSGDSVVILSAGPARARNGPAGFVVRFQPFVPLSDSATVKAAAVKLFRLFLPRIAGAGVQLLVLEAATAPDPQAAFPPGEGYRVVFERHADGRWYSGADASPIDPY